MWLLPRASEKPLGWMARWRQHQQAGHKGKGGTAQEPSQKTSRSVTCPLRAVIQARSFPPLANDAVLGLAGAALLAHAWRCLGIWSTSGLPCRAPHRVQSRAGPSCTRISCVWCPLPARACLGIASTSGLPCRAPHRVQSWGGSYSTRTSS